MAAREAAIQSARVCAPEDSFFSLDGRVKPGHDEWDRSSNSTATKWAFLIVFELWKNSSNRLRGDE